jgi:hypothetical protein
MEIIQMLLCLCIWTPSKMLSMFRVISIPLILSYHHIVCALHRCHVLNVVFLSDVFLLLPGRIRSWCEQQHRVDNTEDQYLSIDEQVKKKNPGYLFYFGYQQTRQATPLWTYGFKVFQNLLFCTTRFNCLLSIDRVILSNACSILLPKYPDPLLLVWLGFACVCR